MPLATSSGMASGDLATPGSADLQTDSLDQPSGHPQCEIFAVLSQSASVLRRADELGISELQRYLYLSTGRLRL